MLRFGSNTSHAREHIADAFQKQKPIEEIAALLKGNSMVATAFGVNTAIMPHGMTETAFICTKAVRPETPLILRSLHGRLQQKESASFAWKKVALLPMGACRSWWACVRSELAQSLLYP